MTENGTETSVVPDARAFVDTMTAARAARSQAYAEARNLTPHSAWNDARLSAEREFGAVLTTAWPKLAKSSHSLLAWIGANIDRHRYSDEVEVILRHLTTVTTLDDLDELAEDRGWCQDWTYQRNRAADAGAFDDLRTA